jgi:DNA-directed RNA polymerase specialized sigma24 family protein
MNDRFKRDYARHHPLAYLKVFVIGRLRTPTTDAAALAERLKGLPEIERNCFVLRFTDGLSQAEIAQRLKLTPEEVERHLVAGLKAAMPAEEGK